MKIKAHNALNAMFVETVDTLVFVALTQHLIQNTMRCENYSTLYKVASCWEGYLLRLCPGSSGIRNILLKRERIHVNTVEMCVLPIVQHQYQMSHLYGRYKSGMDANKSKDARFTRYSKHSTQKREILVFVDTVKDTRFIQYSKCSTQNREKLVFNEFSTQNRQNDVDTVDTCCMQQDKEPS